MSKKVKYTYQVETIDAKKARQYLNKVHSRQTGRNFRGLIDSYAKEMSEGSWDTSVAQTISFDNTGALIDGWHRLHAVEQADVSLPFLVARNVDPDSFSHYDAGKARSMAFRRGITAERQAIISAVVRTALYPHGTNRHTVEENELAENHVREALDYFNEHATKSRRPRITNGSICAGVVFNIMAHPERKAAIVSAYNDMVHAKFDKAPRSMSNLYRRCMEDRRLIQMEFMVLAWHAFNPSKFNNLKLTMRDISVDVRDIQTRVLSDLVGAIK